MLLDLAWQSLRERCGSVLLTLAALCLCVVMVLGVEHVRSQAREVFNRTISGTDLIVGARTSQLNLLLYSVFRIGAPANNVSHESYEVWQEDSRVQWSIPFSLGDSHRGYAVVATDDNFFTHFRYGNRQSLTLADGVALVTPDAAVLGSAVASDLGYHLGTAMVLAHGTAEVSFASHDEAPFTVTGVLAPTGTPVDRAIYIGLAAHAGLHGSVESEVSNDNEDEHQELEHHAEAPLTAFMLGLKSRAAVFGLQRDINEFGAEPLTAILPGVALAELWQALGQVEAVLSLLSLLVALASLLGLATMLLASMQARRREMALYRALGARPWMVVALIELEALLLVLSACIAGYCVVVALLALGQDSLLRHYGIAVSIWPSSPLIAGYALVIVVTALLLALIPAASAYRAVLSSELTHGR